MSPWLQEERRKKEDNVALQWIDKSVSGATGHRIRQTHRTRSLEMSRKPVCPEQKNVISSLLIHVADQKGWGDFLSLINMLRSLKVRWEKRETKKGEGKETPADVR